MTAKYFKSQDLGASSSPWYTDYVEGPFCRRKFWVGIFTHLFDQIRSSCEKCNYRPFGRNRTCGAVIPVQCSNQPSYTPTERQLSSSNHNWHWFLLKSLRTNISTVQLNLVWQDDTNRWLLRYAKHLLSSSITSLYDEQKVGIDRVYRLATFQTETEMNMKFMQGSGH